VRWIAENMAESIAFTYIGETYGQNSEVLQYQQLYLRSHAFSAFQVPQGSAATLIR